MFRPCLQKCLQFKMNKHFIYSRKIFQNIYTYIAFIYTNIHVRISSRKKIDIFVYAKLRREKYRSGCLKNKMFEYLTTPWFYGYKMIWSWKKKDTDKFTFASCLYFFMQNCKGKDTDPDVWKIKTQCLNIFPVMKCYGYE